MPRLRDDCLSSSKAGKEITLSRSSVNIDGRQEAREGLWYYTQRFWGGILGTEEKAASVL